MCDSDSDCVRKSTGQAFKGDLSDISVGELSFFIRISKEETASLLLGGNLNIEFNLPSGNVRDGIDQNGTVVALHSHPFGDYSIYVNFDKALNKSVLKALESIARLDL